VTRLGILCCVACAALVADPARDAARYFDARVAPILTRRCLGCHNEELKNGNISFLDRDSLIRGGSRGPAIVPGKPQESVLMDVLRHDGGIQMPPGPKLPAKEIAVLAEWIKRGAVWGTKLRK
jgi:cytochrome c